MSFIQGWQQKRCNCIYRDVRNVDRLNLVIRGLLVTASSQLKSMFRELSEVKITEELSPPSSIPMEDQSTRPLKPVTKPLVKRGILVSPEKETSEDGTSDSNSSNDDMDNNEEDADDEDEDEVLEDDEYPSEFTEKWSREEREKLFMLTSKVFMYQFPVYGVPHKHNLQSLRLEDLSPKEANLLNQFCDLTDADISLLLLRNIAFFCNQEILDVMDGIFSRGTPDSLPITLAHCLVAVIHQLKSGLNVCNVSQKLVSLRTNVIQYLCKVPEKDLRVPGVRNLFEFIWGAVKDPMDMSKNAVVDKEGLTLAFKYFTSTTLTMRLTGISQINNYISIFTEYSQSEHHLSLRQIQVLQEELTNWILSNQIIEHVFGPNLHVEVIKQSLVVLNFIVSYITCDHVDVIWSAAQLKHCSKQVHDILTQLVKNMQLKSVVHLYSLLRGLEAKDHNDQTLHLASCILKFIWSRSLNIEEPVTSALNVTSIMPGVSPVKTPIFMILPNRNDEGESSSADPSDEEDEDDFDVVVPTSVVQPTGVPQASPGSSSCWSSSSQEAVPENVAEEEADVGDSEADTLVASVKEDVPEASAAKKQKIADDHSSQNSESSLKRMSDFEGEDSNDGEVMDDNDTEEDEISSGYQRQGTTPLRIPTGRPVSKITASPEVTGDETDPLLLQFSIENVCVPGNTIVWDLLQDDKIDHLPEGLAQETEKVLYTLVCWVNDRRLRMRFIEGCLENLEKNTSVIVSLKLLPKFLVSFQGFRNQGCLDIHQVTLWADKERHMLKHFFSTLVIYCLSRSESPGSSSSPENVSSKSRQGRLSHTEEIQIRLQFLQFVLGSAGSPDHFKLTREQLDILWSCLAHDSLCRDELFHWIINQIRGREQHALNHEHFRHILVEKLPEVKSENYSMLALEIVHHLCLFFLNTPNGEDMVPIAIKLLWDIALTAANTDVSMTAIRYLNSYYIHSQADEEGGLTKEKDFIEQCMKFLRDSASLLKTDEEKHSTIIQRAMTLLKTHLEVFRTRYAFHLRKMQLEGDSSVVSHRTKVGERIPQNTLRIICQPASLGERTSFEMQYTDCLGELRAEVTHWWEMLQKKYEAEGGPPAPEGPLRLLTGGQELHPDRDEKQLADLGLKDSQLIYVSVGASRLLRKGRESSEPSSTLSFPPKYRIPMILLLNKSYFEQLFDLAQQLGSMTGPSHIRSQLLSRRVWEIIQMLPTSPDLLNRLQTLTSECKQEENDENRPSQSPQEGMSLLLNELLSPTNPQKLLYCVQIVEYLRRTFIGKERSWSEEFIDCQGLKHVFDIFISGVLQQNESEKSYNEWKQDCLATLLQLIFKFGTAPSIKDRISEVPSTSKDNESTPLSRKKQRKRGTVDKLATHTFNDRILDLLKESETLLRVLLTILSEVSSRSLDRSNYQTGFFGRHQVVHHTIIFLTSWTFSDTSVGHELLKMPNFAVILKKLLLDDPDPLVRREACMGFYRLCMASASNLKKGLVFIPSLLNALLSFISVAQSMRTSDSDPQGSEEVMYSEKESYGPGCKDYFWLVGRLLDSLDSNDKETVNLDRLCSLVTSSIMTREVRESRLTNNEDEGLKGLLSLISIAFKHDPPFKYSPEGKKFLLHVYDCLFSLPSVNDKNAPKCKHSQTRTAAFDLLSEICKDSEDNFMTLANLLLEQHRSSSHPSYPWDFWPHDDCRSDCGYVGLVNLGATCYMASCLQHLFMIPEARKTILASNASSGVKHEHILYELQRMFAFLQESERKSYNPRSFCKVYTMDHELLNTGEQKDMTEFFTDLISKLEEMSPTLKDMVKKLFGGTLSNNVVSLDCPHISRTSEEFYTLRCKVADMKNIFDSLDDLTVKDTLEGDNMYTCSQCGKKVRAEKRACIKKLPRILCFNTMRYTFNMLTMTKEKVNTHFSFPLILNMSPYLEDNLIPGVEPKEGSSQEESGEEYELIGVTVHTGTAEGGHYYSFIREREDCKDRDKWYMFNDAEVKPFDPNQLGSECFGGEMTSKTYDSQTDKYMDFSFEKTNSAYMLFYERIEKTQEQGTSNASVAVLPPDLFSWIWEDNTQFMRDRSIFEHQYFDFMQQVCRDIPSTIRSPSPEMQLLTTKLGTSFLLETLIHSKEKPTMSNWIELLNKQFVSNAAAGEWFLDHMSEDPHWPQQILLKCPNQMIRQLFQRLCVHVVNNLRVTEKDRYLNPLPDCEREGSRGTEIDKLKHVGQFSCVTRFVKKLLTLIKFTSVNKPHPKYLTEYFTFFIEFAKMGEEECRFLLVVEAINTFVQFYLNYCKAGSEVVDMTSDDEEDDDEDVTPVSFRSGHVGHLGIDDKLLRPPSLEKMITFVAYLVEKSRGNDNRLHLSSSDQEVLFSGKMFPFIQRQIRDSVNIKQTINLIYSFCRYNESGASLIVQMLSNSINRMPESSSPFFRVLSLLVEHSSDQDGSPDFGQIVFPRIWEIAEYTPQQSLDWLAVQVIRNTSAHTLVLNTLETWVPYFLITHNLGRVRNSAAHLLVSLVPNASFRQSYNKPSPRLLLMNPRENMELNAEAVGVIQRIFVVLLSLLKTARDHVEFSTSKLVSYFTVMTYCLVSKAEKLMLVPYFNDLWNLFQPRLSEPAVPTNQNKQALLNFWYQACLDCPENIRCIVNSPQAVKNIAFNYILADHEDQETIIYNRSMLPSYYGILRLCCQNSRAFTRQLAGHQNIIWAFKNITPHCNHYSQACNELFKLMKLFIEVDDDTTEQELRQISDFKRNTLHMYLTQLDTRSNWSAIVSGIQTLMEDPEDIAFVIVNNGFYCLLQALNTLFAMFHEATACHVTNDITEVLKMVAGLLEYATDTPINEVKEWCHKWKDQHELIRKLVHLLNTYTTVSVRSVCMSVLEKLINLYPKECIPLLVQSLGVCHLTFQDQHVNCK